MILLTVILVICMIILGIFVNLADMRGETIWWLRRAFWISVILALISFWATIGVLAF